MNRRSRPSLICLRSELNGSVRRLLLLRRGLLLLLFSGLSILLCNLGGAGFVRIALAALIFVYHFTLEVIHLMFAL